jgi:hypothetical protein
MTTDEHTDLNVFCRFYVLAIAMTIAYGCRDGRAPVPLVKENNSAGAASRTIARSERRHEVPAPVPLRLTTAEQAAVDAAQALHVERATHALVSRGFAPVATKVTKGFR